MKKMNIFILLTSLCLFAGTLNAQTFAGGTGIASDPYLIGTTTHMQSMHSVSYTNPVYFKLIADIDMNGISWTPLSSAADKVFHFDGDGYLIKNLSMSGSISYASLFGVLRGSCRNLGVVNASILSTGSGAGIIAGYVGKKTPANVSETGLIENCFTSGVVSGTDAIGGITGNIGKAYSTTYSTVRNCYSIADVTATNSTANSRAGGIAGINYDKGVILNCHSTGTIASKWSLGAGGIVGWTDASITGCVALNDTVKIDISGKLGRVAANMGSIGGVIAQGVNTWASENVVVNNAGVIKTEGEMVTGTVTVANTPYDGATKTSVYLSDHTNYATELSWDFSTIWATSSSFDYPILKWYKDALTTANPAISEGSINIIKQDLSLTITATSNIQKLNIYTLTGNTVYSNSGQDTTITVMLPNKGIYLLSVETKDLKTTKKVLL